jgi:hypothetical protein
MGCCLPPGRWPPQSSQAGPAIHIDNTAMTPPFLETYQRSSRPRTTPHHFHPSPSVALAAAVGPESGSRPRLDSPFCRRSAGCRAEKDLTRDDFEYFAGAGARCSGGIGGRPTIFGVMRRFEWKEKIQHRCGTHLPTKSALTLAWVGVFAPVAAWRGRPPPCSCGRELILTLLTSPAPSSFKSFIPPHPPPFPPQQIDQNGVYPARSQNEASRPPLVASEEPAQPASTRRRRRRRRKFGRAQRYFVYAGIQLLVWSVVGGHGAWEHEHELGHGHGEMSVIL